MYLDALGKTLLYRLCVAVWAGSCLLPSAGHLSWTLGHCPGGFSCFYSFSSSFSAYWRVCPSPLMRCESESEASQLLTHASRIIFIAILDTILFVYLYIYVPVFGYISKWDERSVGNFFSSSFNKNQNCQEWSTRCYLRDAYLCLSFTLHMWHCVNGSSTATVLEGTNALISSCTIGEEGQEFLFYISCRHECLGMFSF